MEVTRMQILIDGDSCNVISATEKIAKKKNIACHIYCDVTREIQSDYSEIHLVDKGKDTADFAILNKCETNDIIITNDSGLAAMVLAKKAYAINSHGFEYTPENIMTYLNKRYMRKHEMCKTNKKQVKGIIKVTHKRLPYNKLLQQVISKSERNTTDYA